MQQIKIKLKEQMKKKLMKNKNHKKRCFNVFPTNFIPKASKDQWRLKQARETLFSPHLQKQLLYFVKQKLT